MPFPADMFGADPTDPDDPWHQLAAIDAALAAPREQPAPAPMQPGIGIPAATVDQTAQPAPMQFGAPAAEPPMPAAPIAPAAAKVTPLGVAADDPSGIAPGAGFDAAMQPPAMGMQPLPEAQPDHPLDASPAFQEAMRPQDPSETDDPLHDLPEDKAVDYAAGLSGDGFARLTAEHAADRDAMIHTRMLEEAKRNRERLELDEKARVEGIKQADKARAQLEADAQQLGNEKLDSGRWWKSRSTGQKIAGFVAAIVGGLVQSRHGGQNEGLAMIDQAINQDIEEQKFNLGKRRDELNRRQGVVSEMYQRTGDQYRAAETARIGAWTSVINQLQAEAQNFDPRGTRALQVAGAIREAQARRAEWMMKFTETQAKTMAEAEKAKLEAEKFAEQKRHAKAEESIAWAGRANDKSRLKLDEKQGERKFAQDDRRLDLEAQKLDAEGKTKEATELRELGLAGEPQVETDANGNAVLDDTGSPKVLPGAALVQRDGTIYKAPSKEVAEDLRKKIIAANELNEVLAEIQDIRDRVGGESSTFNSDDFQRLKVLQNRAIIKEKGATQGMSSDEDMQKIAAAIGVDDVASFRSKSAGLVEARKHVNAALAKELRGHGFNGKLPEFKQARDLPKPAETAEERAYKDAIKEPSVSQTEAETQASKIAHESARRRFNAGPNGQLTPEQKRQYNDFLASETKRLAADYKSISPAQRQHLEQLGEQMKYGKTQEERDRARNFLLQGIADKDGAATQAQRDLIQSLLVTYGGS